MHTRVCAHAEVRGGDTCVLLHCSMPYSFKTLSLIETKSQHAPRILLSPSTRLGSQAYKVGSG